MTPAWLTLDVLESLGEGFVFLDEDQRYRYANQAALHLLQRSWSDIAGQAVWDVFPQPIESPFRAPIDHAFRAREPVHVEGLNVGRGVWFDCYAYPVPGGLVILFRSSTPRKQAELALSESELRFRTLADSAPVLIWMAGPDKGCTYFNQVWLDFTGRPLAAELGSGWAEGVHPDDRARCLNIYTAAFDAREPFEMEYRLRRHDGVYRWLFDKGAPLYDAGGTFCGYIGSCIDIHERRLAEQHRALLAEAGRLLGSSLSYEETLQQVAHLVVPGLGDWCSIEVLDAVGRLQRLGVAYAEEERGRWARAHADDYPSNPDAPYALARVAATGEPVLVEEVADEMLRQSAHDAAHLDFLRRLGLATVIMVPLRGSQGVLGALFLARTYPSSGAPVATYTPADLRFAEELGVRAAIAVENARLYEQARQAEAELRAANESLESRVAERTRALADEVAERRRAEEALGAAVRQLEARNQELQEFAYVASHDLQEPLRKIHTFTELLRADFGAALGAEAQGYLGRMQDAAHRMSRLIHDLLAFSRVTTRAQPFAEVDLGALVQEVLSDLEVRLAETGGTVEVGALPAIEADATQMRQLFQNLIGNALKFHREGVPPCVRVEALRRNGQGREAWIVEVIDNGIGFEPRFAQEIFTPFRRLHGRAAFEGSGIGLAICRRIAERHGGTIEAEGTPQQGAVFRVMLPTTPHG